MSPRTESFTRMCISSLDAQFERGEIILSQSVSFDEETDHDKEDHTVSDGGDLADW